MAGNAARDVQGVLEALRARKLLPWWLTVAATGAIFTVGNLRVQKVSDTEIVVQRGDRARRFPISGVLS